MKRSGLVTLAANLSPHASRPSPVGEQSADGPADYTIRIGTGLIELAPHHIISTTTYNGQFPGPLVRLTKGKRVLVEIHNDTDTPEQLHWHGQTVPPTWTARPRSRRRSFPRAARGEMMALEWTDVNFAKRQLCVQRSDWHGHVTVPKGGRLRYVPMTTRLAAALREGRHLRGKLVLCRAGSTDILHFRARVVVIPADAPHRPRGVERCEGTADDHVHADHGPPSAAL